MLPIASYYFRSFTARFTSDEGAGIVEYLLLIVAIALLVLGAMVVFSGSLSNAFGRIGNAVNNAPN